MARPSNSNVSFDIDQHVDEHMKLLPSARNSSTASRKEEYKTAPLFSARVYKLMERSSDLTNFGLLAIAINEEGTEKEQKSPNSAEQAAKEGADEKDEASQELPKRPRADSLATSNTSSEESPKPPPQASSDEKSEKSSGASTSLSEPAVNKVVDEADSRIFLNTNAPWSAFLCGSQGSGKSYTLACMLENCLWKHPKEHLGPQPNKLSGLVFHYDPLSSTADDIPCEAASLHKIVNIEVLVSLTNLGPMTELYKKVSKKINVKPLILSPKQLDAKTLLSLMAADNDETSSRLYMQVVRMILRELACRKNAAKGVDWEAFKTRCKIAITDRAQLNPLLARFVIVDGFVSDFRKDVPAAEKAKPHKWKAQAGHLTIVDLSCPFIDSDAACGLFDVCLGIFQNLDNKVSKVIGLDEAHKFMTASSASTKLTESLITAIRMQRHRAVRIIVATQEPTISPALLDLCSITLVHRFSSPAWYATLKGHLAAVSTAHGVSETEQGSLFEQIAGLNSGEALLCAPSALIDVVEGNHGQTKIEKLGINSKTVRIRQRCSDDAGNSLMASG